MSYAVLNHFKSEFVDFKAAIHMFQFRYPRHRDRGGMIFLQLSLVCTAVNEFVALCLQKRAKELEKGIRTLLTSPQLVEKFYARTCSSRACDRTKKTFLHSLAHFCVGAHGHCKASLLLTGAVRAATQPVADKETERLSAQLARTLQSPPYKRRRVFGRLRLRHLHPQPPRI